MAIKRKSTTTMKGKENLDAADVNGNVVSAGVAAAAAAAAVSRKHVELPLSRKKDLIKEHEEGISFAILGRKYQVATSTAANIFRKRDFFLSSRMADSRKRCNDRSKFKHVNLVTSIFVRTMLSRHLKIDGEVIKRFALAVAFHSNDRAFHASNGWLDSFKKRENVCWVAKKLHNNQQRQQQSLGNQQQQQQQQQSLGNQQQQQQENNNNNNNNNLGQQQIQQQLKLQQSQQKSIVNDADDPERPRLGEAIELAFDLIKKYEEENLFKINDASINNNNNNSNSSSQQQIKNEFYSYQELRDSSLMANSAFATIELFHDNTFTDRDFTIETFNYAIPFLCSYIDYFDEHHPARINNKHLDVQREQQRLQQLQLQQELRGRQVQHQFYQASLQQQQLEYQQQQQQQFEQQQLEQQSQQQPALYASSDQLQHQPQPDTSPQEQQPLQQLQQQVHLSNEDCAFQYEHLMYQQVYDEDFDFQQQSQQQQLLQEQQQQQQQVQYQRPTIHETQQQQQFQLFEQHQFEQQQPPPQHPQQQQLQPLQQICIQQSSIEANQDQLFLDNSLDEDGLAEAANMLELYGECGLLKQEFTQL